MNGHDVARAGETFHILELPEDEFGNTAFRRAVIEVYRDDQDRLIPVAPAHHTQWSTGLSAHIWTFVEVDGPARMLDDTEYDQLLATVRAGR